MEGRAERGDLGGEGGGGGQGKAMGGSGCLEWTDWCLYLSDTHTLPVNISSGCVIGVHHNMLYTLAA